MLTFLYYTHLKRHSFSIQIPLEKQQLPGYPEFPITVGEHIRKKRMDVGLLQREVAEIIGVTESSIWNWEHGTEPELQYNPSIIKFLGYIPFDCPDDTIGRLAWYRRVQGLTVVALGNQMKIHPDQLYEWLSATRKPFNKSLQRIERFLESQ
ncbi:helix-turn-helix domain-containing protein [Geobacter pelophilus]|uniref:Helix-turn-helix domain-containing protein n=1 Tax=Geoanaerobacter pelophilus TaxID=60036 RepID=A0AAW4L5T0_9BACT|nr:helix-turn-helix domain-containing protein [Geoanaerobacter pelophilus]NTV49178.1 helix-turn-helix domain-containing protein [Geobacteraceae bacterium]NTW79321.1 helix-turn-helix domain-containing protein [Geobacteraceae bacterium]